MMQAYKDQSAPMVGQHLPENVLSKIPKEWNYIPQDPKFNETSKSKQSFINSIFIYLYIFFTIFLTAYNICWKLCSLS